MTGILADYNLVGHVTLIVGRMNREPWTEFWQSLGLGLLTFADLGLSRRTPDDVLWRRCQADGLVLITANRNHDGGDSLEAVIRAENTPANLPVFTVSTAAKVFTDRAYLDQVAESLIDYLIFMDAYRGTGRLFLP